jgi:Transcriptional regulator
MAMKSEHEHADTVTLKSVRQPKQTRSINKKEKVLDAALELFCEKGYYKTSTNEIAQRAGVSIGTLYSYFKDKDTIFFEIQDKYHKKFEVAKNELLKDPGQIMPDFKNWLITLIKALVKVHEESREFNRELYVLSFYNPEIAKVLEENKENTRKETLEYFIRMKDSLKIHDPEAVATVTFDLISTTVDRIVFGKNEIESERLIDSAADIIYTYLVHYTKAADSEAD